VNSLSDPCCSALTGFKVDAKGQGGLSSLVQDELNVDMNASSGGGGGVASPGVTSPGVMSPLSADGVTSPGAGMFGSEGNSDGGMVLSPREGGAADELTIPTGGATGGGSKDDAFAALMARRAQQKKDQVKNS